MALSITTPSLTTLCHYAECCCAGCHNLFIVLLNVIILSVVKLSVVMLSAVMLSAVMLSVVMLSVVPKYLTVV
jgi:hypothetical protein